MKPKTILRVFMIALLVALSFPPTGLWPLGILAFALFSQEMLDPHPRNYALWVGAYGFLVSCCGHYWVSYLLHEFASMPWPLAVLSMLGGFLALALGSAFFGWLWSQTRQRIARKHWPLALFIWFLVWDSLEYRFFPWSPAMAVGSNKWLMASVGIFGIFGWRVLFYSMAEALALITLGRSSRKNFVLKVAGISAAYALITFGVGYWNYQRLNKQFAARQPVALLQGNVGNLEKKISHLGVSPTTRNIMRIHRDLVEQTAIHFAEKSTGPLAPEPWVFWPETSMPGFPLSENHTRDTLFEWVKLTRGLHLVGSYDFGPQVFAGKEINLQFNAVLLVHEKSGFLGHYRKRIRIPFGEFIPGADYLPQLYDWLPAVNHFGAGTEFVTLPHPDSEGPVFVPVVCYEVLFRSYVSDFVAYARKQFPDRELVLVNPTNDSWYGPTAEPFHHSFLARWRAASLELPLLRPTNTGFSQIISPWGEVLASSSQDEQTVLFGELPVEKVQLRSP